MTKFVKVLNELLKTRNMTQTQLSELTGISPASLSRYVSGKNEPRMDIIICIADAFKVSPSCFIEEENNVEPYKKIMTILARNGDKLTDDEKKKIVHILLFGGK